MKRFLACSYNGDPEDGEGSYEHGAHLALARAYEREEE